MTLPSKPTQIRDAAYQRILGATMAGERVFKTRMVKTRLEELPCVSVYTSREDIDPESLDTAPRVDYCTLQLYIEGEVIGDASGLNQEPPNDPSDDKADLLLQQIRQVLFTDFDLGGLLDGWMESASQTAVVVSGSDCFAGFRMTVECYYRRPFFDDSDGDASIGDFRRFEERINVDGLQARDDQADAVVPIPQLVEIVGTAQASTTAAGS